MTNNVAPQLNHKAVSEDRVLSCSFKGKLDAGELLTGSPTIAEIGTSDLTFSNIGVNTVALTINGAPVAIGEAVQFKVTGGVANTLYKIRISPAGTDGTPSQKLSGTVRLRVIPD